MFSLVSFKIPFMIDRAVSVCGLIWDHITRVAWPALWGDPTCLVWTGTRSVVLYQRGEVWQAELLFSPSEVSETENYFQLDYNRTTTSHRCSEGLFCTVLLMADLIAPIRAALWPDEFMYSWSLIMKCKSSLLWKRDFFFPPLQYNNQVGPCEISESKKK